MLSASRSRFVQRAARNEALLPVRDIPDARPGATTIPTSTPLTLTDLSHLISIKSLITNSTCFALLSVPLLYHSMGQIIKSVFCLCMYVCVCVCGHAYGRILPPIFTKFGKNLWGLNRKNWFGWGRNPTTPYPILAPKAKILWAWIGISSQICKNFKSSYLKKTIHRISIKFDRPMWPNEKTWWVVQYDDVTNQRWRTAAILDFDFGPETSCFLC